MRVICYQDPGSARSRRIAVSMAKGAEWLGHTSMLKSWDDPAVSGNDAELAIGYGWAFPEILRRHPAFVHVDLGWWGRKPAGDPTGGYHKVAVNARDPAAYFRAGLPRDRFSHFMLSVRPWRSAGKHVLLAGTSAKSAATRGMSAFEWETGARDLVRKYTDRPLLFRPKPSFAGARPIDGCAYSPPHQSLDDALKDCWAIVTLHSNVAVDGLVAGIPAFGGEGIALAVSSGELSELEAPRFPEDRIEILSDLAFCQFTPDEMASGLCLKHLFEHTPLKDLS